MPDSGSDEVNEAKQELFAAKIADGTPGLYLALKNGCHQATESYIDGVFSASLGIALNE
ncbi:hypothetical protein [Piscirickettsia salmonis]|uniref:Uncharacterized protein n=2 Tax=Piscirickettsia salmonis TaxID=1238 RepID=A0A9Q6LK12_PISSA|nr:hypothetical protein [Piscirickettsia salmonis]ALA24633.1 ankyrin repeat family protein [Piscirickettsia salmonis]QGN95455.1 hypothetical protein Psal006a_02073 [Piscirickettsia salmonis]QGO05596.1 hypothetical protein Psal009_01487 [Piscirickettsia salmonis]QGO33917.1 hypothetical protein Psal028_01234 [Piscirickettsia salmonis]QGO37527.1 hypothetical protein Psal040_01232 [Piscirickettsia salmonis]